MNQIVKQEMVRLAFSLFFMVVLMVAAYLLLPKMTERMGQSQASAFWKQEREEQEKRLFGGD